MVCARARPLARDASPKLVLPAAAHGQNARSHLVSSLRRAAAHAGRCRRAAARAVSFRGRNRGGKREFDLRQADAVRNWLGARAARVRMAAAARDGRHGEPARVLATNLIAQWIKRNSRYSEPAWLPEMTARRLSHIFAHGRFVISNSDLLWRSKLFVFCCASNPDRSRALRRARPKDCNALKLPPSARCPVRVSTTASAGLQRGSIFFACRSHSRFCPDGGYVSRSPEGLVHAYRFLVMVVDAMTATGHEIPQDIRSAHDRMAPMLRFFRHGDGALALFNGGRECDGKMMAGLLARDEVRGQPFAYAPHSGFQRMAASRAVLMLDCGTLPKPAFSERSHAGCLSFEFSAGMGNA